MIEFIAKHVNSGRNVLVHCFAGISRSVSAVIAYMIKELGFTCSSALSHLSKRRP